MMRKLLILCVDALDYETAKKLGYPKLPYECKLDIPKELYHKGKPHSLKVWPSMMTGRIIDTKIWGRFGETKFWLRKIFRGFLKLIGRDDIINNARDKGGCLVRASNSWRVRPDNMDEENVFDNYDSIIWNIPTITPECLMHFPSRNSMYEYSLREYDIWKMVVFGMLRNDKKLCAAYTHMLDVSGHMMIPDKKYYMDIEMLIKTIRKIDKNVEIMVVSDHGMKNGGHTKYAYLGCTMPINACSVLDVRREIENTMGNI